MNSYHQYFVCRMASVALASMIGLGAMTATRTDAGPPQLSTNPAKHIIFPSKGQTPEQQEKDQLDAYNWATQQTEWDPYNALGGVAKTDAAGQKVEEDTKGKAIGGALRGALLGVAIGAVAGDAEKGAAIGATAGGLSGGMQSRQVRNAAKSGTRAAEEEYQRMFKEWDRHFVAAMEGKGYVVK